MLRRGHNPDDRRSHTHNRARHADTGSTTTTKDQLTATAQLSWTREWTLIFDADRVVVIGDTPFDVSAAHEVGVRAIGVATGSSTIEDLMAAQADIVLPDLTDTEAVIRAICPAALA